MIKAENLSFEYKGRSILRDLSMTLAGGELCSVIGANGSGKTTLIRLLGRALTPSGGSIEVDSRNSTDYSSKEYAQKISVLHQSRHSPSISAADFIAGGRYPYLGFSGRLTDADIAALNDAVALTGTESLLDRDLRQLSGGERQRVCFAMLLAQSTPYVLLDEPSTFLDAAAQIELYGLIKGLKSKGKGILAVSHDLSFALKYSDKILLLKNGSVAFCGKPSDSRLFGAVEQALGVRIVSHTVENETEYFIKEII